VPQCVYRHLAAGLPGLTENNLKLWPCPTMSQLNCSCMIDDLEIVVSVRSLVPILYAGLADCSFSQHGTSRIPMC
jgi:hypothetical protein